MTERKNCCTFFGHRDSPIELRPLLDAAIEKMISDGITVFLVGNQGNFDCMVREALEKAVQIYPQIRFFVIHAYPLSESEKTDKRHYYPSSLKSCSSCAAIPCRNRWMVEKCGTAIVRISHCSGGAYQAAAYAEKCGLHRLSLSDVYSE